MTNKSESVEMYLKTIAELGGSDVSVSVGRLAERLGVTAVSANEMVKRLSEQNLTLYQPYKGVILTNTGRELAHNVIRRQRLWECFLVNHLKVDWAAAFDQACDLEHATASEVTESLAVFLGNPSACPHGNPIPDQNGRVPPAAGQPLSFLDIGVTAKIVAILPESSEVFSYLNQRGLRPSQTITLLETSPLDGLLSIQTQENTTALGLKLAELVMVEPQTP